MSYLEREELPRERLDGAQKGAQSMVVLEAMVSSEGGMALEMTK